jgi:hypothetical protein
MPYPEWIHGVTKTGILSFIWLYEEIHKLMRKHTHHDAASALFL